MPIRILNTPKLVESTEPYRVPANWNPVDGTGGQPCYLWQDEQVKSDYYKKVYDANWKVWHKKSGATIVSAALPE